VLFGRLRVAELVDLHELLQALPEVQGEQVDPHQAARVQDQLQGVQLQVQVGTRDYKKEGGGEEKLGTRYDVTHSVVAISAKLKRLQSV